MTSALEQGPVQLPEEPVSSDLDLLEREGELAAIEAVVGDGDSMAGSPLARERWSSVPVPTLVLDGGQTPWLAAGADALAGALPHARRSTLEGQPHDVPAEALAPALKEFFGA